MKRDLIVLIVVAAAASGGGCEDYRRLEPATQPATTQPAERMTTIQPAEPLATSQPADEAPPLVVRANVRPLATQPADEASGRPAVVVTTRPADRGPVALVPVGPTKPVATSMPDRPGPSPIAADIGDPAEEFIKVLKTRVDPNKGGRNIVWRPPVGATSRPAGPVATGPAAAKPRPNEVKPVPTEAAFPVGLPEGFKPDFTMPGAAGPPDSGDDKVRKQAACQAAVLVAIYNVTKELNDKIDTDPVENDTVNSDHFRYKDGLEVKSQTLVVSGRVKAFDIWVVVPAVEPSGGAAGAPKFVAHVRNFALDGTALTGDQIDRLLAAAGGHLAVIEATGPDDRGRFTAEVGLVRKTK